MEEDLKRHVGKWHLLQMSPFTMIGHVTCIKINEKGEVWFRDNLNAEPSKILLGPNGLQTEWKDFSPKSEILQICRLFYFTKKNGGKFTNKYYDHQAFIQEKK